MRAFVKCKICGAEERYECGYGSVYPHVLAMRWLLRHVTEKHPNEREYIKEIENELRELEQEFHEEVMEFLYMP